MKFIYLIAELDKEIILSSEEVAYKIGVTKNSINKRIKQLSTGNSKVLHVIKEFKSEFAYKLESVLHKIFQDKKINKEFFALTKEDVNNFIGICQKYENNFKILENYKINENS